MKFRVGIENNNESIRSMAWALEHPGCYSYGKDQDEALASLPAAVRGYAEWTAARGAPIAGADAIELELEDVWTAYYIDDKFERMESGTWDDNEIGAWFQHDWKPLAAEDIERGLRLLEWTRADMLETVGSLSPAQWARKAEGERWDIAGIVLHVGGADRWYVDRIGLAFPRNELPDDPIQRLEKTRAWMRDILEKLEGVDKVVGIEGEFWSPRKVLRRAVWHERDHTEHIRKLL